MSFGNQILTEKNKVLQPPPVNCSIPGSSLQATPLLTSRHLLAFSFLQFLFTYSWPCWVFTSVHVLSLVAASGSPLCCGAPALACAGFRSCGREGLVASRHVGSSQTRDRTCVPFISRQTLIHWATREAPHSFLHIFVQ